MRQIKQVLSTLPGLTWGKQLGICAILLLGSSQVAFAQSKVSYKGKIVDASGEPIIGATIKEKGTNNGVATDLDGNFTIEAKSGATLVASYVGMKTLELKPADGKLVTVTMKDDSKVVDEVVVVGYGTQKKANLTGSVASVTSKDLTDIPTANATNLLQGRLPGVTLTSNGGLAGGDTPEIRIRGIGTFGNNDPMVLIDGVEASVAQIQQIAATDIDNISVLKDAASAAIYGVRAANGVILDHYKAWLGFKANY